MTLVHGRITTEKVIIPVAVHIPDKDAGAPVQDDGQRMIVVGSIFLFQLKVM
jgi:hypothetical protein